MKASSASAASSVICNQRQITSTKKKSLSECIQRPRKESPRPRSVISYGYISFPEAAITTTTIMQGEPNFLPVQLRKYIRPLGQKPSYLLRADEMAMKPNRSPSKNNTGCGSFSSTTTVVLFVLLVIILLIVVLGSLLYIIISVNVLSAKNRK